MELRESPMTRSPIASSTQSSPRHRYRLEISSYHMSKRLSFWLGTIFSHLWLSPRRTGGSMPPPSETNDENPWLNELGSFELKQSGVSVKAPPQREIYHQNGSPDRSALRKSLDRQLNSYVSPDLHLTWYQSSLAERRTPASRCPGHWEGGGSTRTDWEDSTPTAAGPGRVHWKSNQVSALIGELFFKIFP